MIDTRTLALILLTERILAVIFMAFVLYRQVTLFKYPILDRKVRLFRRALFVLAVSLMVTNLVPIAVDVSAFMGWIEKSTGSPTIYGLAYTLSNATTSLVSAIAIFMMYLFARNATDHKVDTFDHKN